MPRLEPPPYNHCRWPAASLHTDAFVSAQGFVDNESTLRSIKWTLYEVNKTHTNSYVLDEEYSTNNSRRAEEAGSVDTVFDNSILGLTSGLWYKIKFTGKNGADLTTEVWSNIFSYDETPPDVTGGLATLCPPMSALRLDLRSRFDCGSWPTPLETANDLDRHQASTSLLKVPAGTHSRPALTLRTQSPYLSSRMQSSRVAHRHRPSHVLRAQVRWSGFVDLQSQVVRCELRIIDADHAEVCHEAHVPCNGAEQQIEMTGLNLQHTHAR